MNEQEVALGIRRALDGSAERLPYRVTHRLEAARRNALANLPQAQVQASVQPSAVTSGTSLSFSTGPETIPLWARVAITALPVLVLVGGLTAISLWNDTTVAAETAALDAAMLVDDVPITAYLDRGFGVYLKNTQP